MTIGNVVKRYPLITFCVLAYALSWWAWPLFAMDLIPIPVASFGPFLAALVVLAITWGKRGVSGLLRRMVQWRIGFRWYVLALLIPIGLTGIATALNLLLGAAADPSASDSWPSLFATFAVVLLVPGLGGAWEEPGWREGSPCPACRPAGRHFVRASSSA